MPTKKKELEEPIHEISVEGIIQAMDLETLNLPENLNKLWFVIQPRKLVQVAQVIKIHPAGQLDLKIVPYLVSAPTGMKNAPDTTPLPVDYPKVRRDDLGREAGTYKIVG